jgi:carboxymethylenebutenolidase
MRLGMIPAIGCLLCICAEDLVVMAGERAPSELAPGVWGVLAAPETTGTHPGVILLHGAAGWSPGLVDLGSAFAAAGFVTLTLDYYAEAKRTPAGSPARVEAWPGYQAALQRAVTYVASLPSTSRERIGLVGFSRGGFLAVSVASSREEVGAIVSFYGGGGGGQTTLEEDVEGLPPALILHGEADRVVPVSSAYALRDAVLAAGGEAELHVYAGAGHSFNSPTSTAYTASAAGDAHRRTLEFLKRRLVSGQAGAVRPN